MAGYSSNVFASVIHTYMLCYVDSDTSTQKPVVLRIRLFQKAVTVSLSETPFQGPDS